jgi:hypothetical protein
MRKLIMLILLMTVQPWIALAQKNKIVTIEATGEVPFPDDKSRKEVEGEAEAKAIFNGLRKTFGEFMFKGDAASGTNNQQGANDPKTSNNYAFYGMTELKGNLLEVKDKKCEVDILQPSVTGRELPEKICRCTIRFTAMEASGSQPTFIAYPLWSPNKKSRGSDFANEDTLYLYFSSTSTGYLSVYLDDTKTCQQLLPFKWMGPESEDGVKLEADKEYILFNPKNNLNYYDTMGKSDYLTLFTEKAMELNRLIVIFSKSPVTKPPLKEGLGMENPTEADIKNLPKAISTKEFEQWRITRRSLSKDMTERTFLITIKKKDAE